MVDLLQQILNGLVIGSVYALVALGLTLIYGILYIPNFAHGQAYMWAAYVTFFLITFLGMNYWVVILVVTFIFILLGMAIEWAIFKPLMDKPHINGFIAAIGMVMLMESLVLIVFGAEYHKFPEGFSVSGRMPIPSPCSSSIAMSGWLSAWGQFSRLASGV